MKEFELQLRLRNNLIKSRRLALGLSAKECAERCGVSYPLYLRYEALTASPVATKVIWNGNNDREIVSAGWRPSARRIAAFFGCSPEELFPEAVIAVKTPVAVTQIAADQAMALAAYSGEFEAPEPPDGLLEKREAYELIHKAIERLPPRQRAVIRARFFDDKTLRGAGESVGHSKNRRQALSPERTRQLERCALRQINRALRSPDLDFESNERQSRTMGYPVPFDTQWTLLQRRLKGERGEGET